MAEATAEVTEAVAEATTNFVSVMISKAKRSLDVDVNALPEEVYQEVIIKGLQSVLGRGMGEVKIAGLEGDALKKEQDAAFTIAQENLEKCYKGEIRLMAAKKVKTKGKERTEALRIAKQLVKDQMKEEGLKVSHYSAKEITLAAEQVLEDNPDILEEAKRILAEREKKSKGKVKISLKTTMKADEKKVKAAKEKAEKAKAATAAKKAKGEKATGARA